MDIIKDYWGMIVALVGLVAWFVRLEAKVTGLTENRKDDLVAAREAREATSSKLERLETQIGNRFDNVDEKIESVFTEMRSDIKVLIGQVASRPARAVRRNVTK